MDSTKLTVEVDSEQRDFLMSLLADRCPAAHVVDPTTYNEITALRHAA